MRGPVQFEAALRARNVCPVEVHVHVFGNLVVRKLDKSVADWCALDFVSNQFD